MPEGPEVSIITNQLNKLLKKTCLHQINLLSGPYLHSDVRRYSVLRSHVQKVNNILTDSNDIFCFTKVKNKGKFMYFELLRLEIPKTDQFTLKNKVYFGSSLGTTGHWRLQSDDVNLNHVRIEIIFSNSPQSKTLQKLWYVDIRSQGNFYVESSPWLDDKLNHIGPDVYKMSYKTFLNQMKTPRIQNKQLHEVLLDQSIISGIGNYLRADILYYTAHEGKNLIPIFTTINKLSTNQIKHLFKSIKKIIKIVLASNGTSTQNYVDLYGKIGMYVPIIYKQSLSPNNKKIIKLSDKTKRTFYYVE